MQRRELAASYRSPTKPMPAAREQANLRWAEQEAERMAMEERDRLERRARDWKLRGAAVGTWRWHTGPVDALEPSKRPERPGRREGP
jgi:hypothetical protein